jgi:hypothetical protein
VADTEWWGLQFLWSCVAVALLGRRKINNEELNIFLFIWASTLKRCVEARHVDPSKHGSDETSYNTLVGETSGLGDVSVKERSS